MGDNGERVQLSVGTLPGRKSKALTLTRFHAEGGATLEPLAYFRSEKAYDDFRAALDGRALYLTGAPHAE